MSMKTTEIDQPRGHELPKKVLIVDTRQAIIGGVLAALISMVGVILPGRITNFEARGLLEAMMPSVHFLSSSVMTASATIMALMLTLLSLSQGARTNLRPIHYHRIQQIGFMDAIAFIGSVILLMFVSIPLNESQAVVPEWYSVLYYLLLIFAAALGGVVVTIVLSLYNVITSMILLLSPEEVDLSDLIFAEEELTSE
ncbi:MAG: hypothetical protein IPL78_07485 [Chloroflexi bacterium]|nr:hypothetical protein [Chloroflexota bacterium]